jgi:Protein of unknown function (DUF3015)
MKKLMTVVMVSAIAFVASAAFAGGNVGVGLGTVLLKGKSGKVLEVLAVTTNGSTYTSTFGITSGTSGYQEGQAIGMNEVEIFVAKNMDSLATDIARGDGEYLNTLVSMMEVKDSVAFKTKLKTNFDKIYTESGVTSKEVVAHINDVVNS